MIAKHITAKGGGIGNLADYIDDEEKTRLKWTAGCVTDDFKMAVKEIEATQSGNRNNVNEKTYHLVISFQQSDKEKLSNDDYKAIESEIANVLGFGEHQRLCALHTNTDHYHLHIAYNTINPITYKKERSFHRYAALRKLCNQIEKKYGLEPIKMDVKSKSSVENVPAKAKDKVAHTGQESFYDYIIRHKIEILQNLNLSKKWSEFHQGLLMIGIHLKRRGAGLIFTDRDGKHYASPSKIDRSLSKGNLEKRFGAYEDAPQEIVENAPINEQYKSAPSRFAERVTSKELYDEFKAKKRERLDKLSSIRSDENERYQNTTEKYKRLKQRFRSYPHYLERIRIMEMEEKARNKAIANNARQSVRAEIPFNSWDAFLAFKARQGDDNAKTLLDYRQKKQAKEPMEQPYKTDGEYQRVEMEKQLIDKIVIESMRQQENITRKRLGFEQATAFKAIIKMDEVLKIENIKGESTIKLTGNTIRTIAYAPNKLEVLFNFSDGSKIIASSKKISWEGQNENVKRLAQLLAQKKWGKRFELTGNALQFASMQGSKVEAKTREDDTGLSR